MTNTIDKNKNFESIEQARVWLHAAKLYRRGRVNVRIDREARFVFETVDHGNGCKVEHHSIDVFTSSPARVLAHFEGFCRTVKTGDCFRANVGDRVEIPHGSSRSGYRTGSVVKVGPKRATVRFVYRHGGVGQVSVGHEDVVILLRSPHLVAAALLTAEVVS